MGSNGNRPGGLTALAVFSILGAIGLILTGGGAIFVSQSEEFNQAMQEATESEEAQAELTEDEKVAVELIGDPDYQLASGVRSLLVGILLLIAAIGYLKMSKTLGFTVGIIYCIASIGSYFLVNHVMFDVPDQGIGIVLAFLFPAITLLCLLLVFKSDFDDPVEDDWAQQGSPS